MAAAKIASIGFASADDSVDYVEFDSNASLLDFDIVMFKIPTDIFLYSPETYQGKPCLSDDQSFKVRDRFSHWRRELKDFADSGKIAYIFLSEYKDGHLATGEKRYSGTGRNRHVTRIVEIFYNYSVIPIQFKPTSAHGFGMTLTKEGSEIFGEYWRRFESSSKYHAYFDQKDVRGYIVTKNGSRPVGSILRAKNSNGAIVLLPDLDFDDEEFSTHDTEIDEEIWTDKARKFFLSLTETIVQIRSSIQSGGEVTPAPDWIKGDTFKSNEELEIRNEIAKNDAALAKIIREKEELESRLAEAESLKGLLYEKGKQLEKSVLKALKILGYQAENFNGGGLELDAVFCSEEGRLIGEVEGKDNKQINITKLRQIALNVHEDFEREDVQQLAKGVLFGNPFRLLPLEHRDEPFTEKCLTASSVSGIALVSTPDLFSVSKYIFDNADAEFSTECRRAILNGSGRILFPTVPTSEEIMPKTNELLNDQK